MIYQRTIRRALTIEGVGLHSGERATLEVRPAAAGFGIRFRRKGREQLAATFKNVKASHMAVTLGDGPSSIATVEHLLSAASALSLDNLEVEVDGPEVPILDGSSYPFLSALESAGIAFQPAPRSFVRVKRRVEVVEGNRSVVLLPNRGLEISAEIDWAHPLIGKQIFEYTHDLDTYRKISASRTFGFAEEAERLRAMGLAKGGSLETAVVLDGEQVLNPEGLRFRDEFVRHKVLDAVGDLSLAGHPLDARAILVRSGHALHVKALAALFASDANYEIVRHTGADLRGQARRFAVAAI